MTRYSIQLPSRKPPPIGTQVGFRLVLADDSTIFSGAGRVIQNHDLPQGVGMMVEFQSLDPDSQDLLAYLFSDDIPGPVEKAERISIREGGRQLSQSELKRSIARAREISHSEAHELENLIGESAASRTPLSEPVEIPSVAAPPDDQPPAAALFATAPSQEFEQPPSAAEFEDSQATVADPNVMSRMAALDQHMIAPDLSQNADFSTHEKETRPGSDEIVARTFGPPDDPAPEDSADLHLDKLKAIHPLQGRTPTLEELESVSASLGQRVSTSNDVVADAAMESEVDSALEVSMRDDDVFGGVSEEQGAAPVPEHDVVPAVVEREPSGRVEHAEVRLQPTAASTMDLDPEQLLAQPDDPAAILADPSLALSPGNDDFEIPRPQGEGEDYDDFELGQTSELGVSAYAPASTIHPREPLSLPIEDPDDQVQLGHTEDSLPVQDEPLPAYLQDAAPEFLASDDDDVEEISMDDIEEIDEDDILIVEDN